jgi:Holliday junction resolvase RusA-like endonuclease
MGLCRCHNQSVHLEGFGTFCNGVSTGSNRETVDKELEIKSEQRQRLLVTVEGRPAPQGSKSYRGNNRFVEASKYLPAWRSAIVLAIKREIEESQTVSKFDSPVKVSIDFFIERPKNPKFAYPATTPDLDKLVRGVFDSITQSGAWTDDCLVVQLQAREVWTGTSTDSYPLPGARIYIERL